MQFRGKQAMSVLFAVLLALVSVLAGCSSSTDSGTTSAGSAVSPTGETGADGSEDQGEQSRYGGILKIAYNLEPNAIGWPALISTYEDQNISRPAIENLGRYNSSGELEPFLAERWETDPQNNTVTFYLRQGILFHDGTEFDAEAVKWNIEQFMASGRNELKGITSIDVLDKYTVRLNMDSWNNSMINSVCVFVGMVSPTAAQQNGAEWAAVNPVGTGPFKFDGWERQVSIKYVKNENYWQEGLPYLDGIEIKFIADTMSAAAAFKSGEVHAYMNLTPETAHELSLSGAEIITASYGGRTFGIIGNSADPNSPFADVRVRKALGHAIDSKAIVDSLYYGYAKVTNQWGVPGGWSYNPYLVGQQYDPEKAKQLLADAGYPDGFQTKLVIDNSQEDRNVFTAVQAYLKAVGINAEIDVVDKALYVSMTSGDGVWGDGLVSYHGKAEVELGTYMPRNLSAKGTLYVNGITHPQEVEDLFEELRAALDDETKKEVAHRLQSTVYEKYALITNMFVTTWPGAKHPELKDEGWQNGHSHFWTPEKAYLQK